MSSMNQRSHEHLTPLGTRTEVGVAATGDARVTARKLSRFVTVVLVAGLLLSSGCSSPQNEIDGYRSLAEIPSARATLPDEDALTSRFAADSERTTGEEALFAAWYYELMGDLDSMQAALIDSDVLWNEPLLLAARNAMILRTVKALIDPESELAQWIQQQSTPGDPLSYWILSELRAQANVDAHVLAKQSGFPVTDGLGAPSSWRVTGPLSPYGVADFGRDFGMIRAQNFEARGVRDDAEVSIVPSDGVSTTFSMPGAGVGFAETFVDTPEGFSGLLAFRGPAPAEVYIDGRSVVVHPTEDRWESDLLLRRIELSPGSHRVVVKFGTSGDISVKLRLLGADDRPVVNFNAEPRGWSADSAVRLGRGTSPYATELLPAIGGLGELTNLATAELLRVTGGASHAYRLYDSFENPQHPYTEMRRADLAFWVDTLPSTQREELALSALPAESTWPMLKLMRAFRIEAAGQSEESLMLLEEAAAAAPSSVSIQYAFTNALSDEGWDEIVEPILEHLASEHPERCDVVVSYLELRVLKGGTVTPEDTPELWHRCYGVELIFFEGYYMPRQRYEEALAFAKRSASWNPTNAAAYDRWIDVARAMGSEEELDAARDSAAEHSVERRNFMLLQADDALAGGAEARAADLVESYKDEVPASLLGSMAQLALTGEQPFGDLRVDGVELVRQYQASEHSYSGPVVYVHDYLGARYFEDGSTVEVVHQILQLRTRDALEANGEMGIPWNAELLTARVIKPDGRTLSPESIPEKDSISMPNLEMGDFVELEWVSISPRRAPASRTYRAPRFYFQTLDAPLHRSIASYQYPRSWGSALTFDIRNFDGEHTRDRVGDSIREIFTVESSEVPHPEPSSPPSEEWLPSIQLSMNFDWPTVVAQYTGFVLEQAAPDAGVRMRAQRFREASNGERDLVRRIFRYVNDEILDQGGYFSTAAATSIEMKEGDRLASLWSLLDAAGLKPSLVLVQTITSDQTSGDIVNPDAFGASLIRVEADGDYLWLDPVLDHYPFNYIEPLAQNSPAFIVAGADAGTRTRTPAYPDSYQLSTSELLVRLDEAGNATGVVTETVPVATAPGFLSFLNYIESDRQLIQALERQLSDSFPGATVQSLEINGDEDYDTPLQLTYEFSVTGLAIPRGDSLIIERTPFTTSLAQVYAGYLERDRALLVSTNKSAEITYTFELPDGYRAETRVSDEDLEYGNSRYVRKVLEDKPGLLSWTRRVDVPIQRVAPDAYGEFARFIRRVDALEDLSLRFVPVD